MRSTEASAAVSRQLSPPALSAPLEARGSEYAQLSRQIKQAGLLERRPAYYVAKIAVTVGLLAAGWAAFVLVGNSWWQLAVAAFLAVMFTQMGFLGHDAGHRQIFGSRRANYVLGVLHGNLGIGLSYGRAVSRLVYRYQAYLFFPMLLGEAISLHTSSIRALTSPASRHRPLEIALLAAHTIGYLTLVFLVLSPVKAVVFIVVQQGLFGLYLGSSFAPNHKGMPILQAGDKTDFLRRQVLTSRNVRGGWLTDFALGGLNYQIEHHLFPSMPRPNLRRSKAMIETFCQQRDLPYCESSLVGSYAQALRYLNTVGRLTRSGSAA